MSDLAMEAAVTEMLLFRESGELFALDLRAADEVLEMPPLSIVPDMAGAMMGVFPLRGTYVPVFATYAALGVCQAGPPGVVLILRRGDRRVGLALDDVEDVITVDASQLHRPPSPDGAERVVVGVERRGGELVGIVDAATLVEACAALPSGDIG
ncbi:MAG TPA: chemotaxis protein CheW [Gemmatimonadaceae bacterium]|jgi:chemotaxis signal transduction protein